MNIKKQPANRRHKKASQSKTKRLNLVGIPGFEPGAPCSQSRCANRTALYPEYLRLKKRLQKKEVSNNLKYSKKCGGEGGIRTRGTPFEVRRFSKPVVSATHPPHRAGFANCFSFKAAANVDLVL